MFYALDSILSLEGSSRSRFQAYNPDRCVFLVCPDWLVQLFWRNWLARSTVNRKVGGSGTARSECLFIFYAFVTFL